MLELTRHDIFTPRRDPLAGVCVCVCVGCVRVRVVSPPRCLDESQKTVCDRVFETTKRTLPSNPSLTTMSSGTVRRTSWPGLVLSDSPPPHHTTHTHTREISRLNWLYNARVAFNFLASRTRDTCDARQSAVCAVCRDVCGLQRHTRAGRGSLRTPPRRRFNSIESPKVR